MKMARQHRLFKVGNFIFDDNAFEPACECGSEVYYLNIGRDHFWVCDHCRKYLYFGSNLMDSWESQTEEEWELNRKKLSNYEMIGV